MKRKPLTKSIRDAIIERDITCRLCRIRPVFHIHHIEPKYKGGQDTLSNLIGLCLQCHWSAGEGRIGLRQQKNRGSSLWHMFMAGYEAHKAGITIFSAMKQMIKTAKAVAALEYLADMGSREEAREEMRNIILQRMKSE